MCKTPGRECKPMEEDIPIGDNNVVSEDESEPMDSDSFYTDSSSDEGESDSDAESGSGNRVTKDMVVLLMLKENSVISEEWYSQKAENSGDDIKPLMPKIPKSDPSSDAESFDDDPIELFLAARERERVKKERAAQTANKGEAESLKNEESQESLQDNKSVEKQADVKENAAGDIPVEAEKMPAMMQEKDVVIDFNEKGDGEATTTIQQQQALTEIKQEGTYQGENPQIVQCEDISESANAGGNEESEKDKGKALESVHKLVSDCQKVAEDCSITTEKLSNLLNDFESKLVEKKDKSKQDKEIKEPKSKIQLDPNKMTKSFEYILKQLVQEKRISEDYEYVDVLVTYVKDLDKYYVNNEAVDKYGEATEELREFAFFLNYYSPSSYKYIIATFNTPLPEHKVLCSWYMKHDHRPGLSKRAFDILKRKSSEKRLTCALMARDIFLTNYGFNYDQVDYGGGCNYEYTDKAVMAFVFLLVSLDEDWKMPIGYIFAKCVPPESQAELIRVCLVQCDDAGVDVVAVTVDTLTPATFLGCSLEDPKNLRTTFKHPACDRDVAVWIDPCLALRSARHTLKVKEVLRDGAGAKIRWNLLRKLRKLLADENIDYDKPGFLKLRNHVAKVGLTTEIFSDSLAPALELCEELLPDMFRDTAATRKYIEIVNSLYDILNSRTNNTRIGDVMNQLNLAKEYMLGLFCNEANMLSPFDKTNLSPDKKLLYRSFVEGKPACGYIGFLICIESFKHLHATLVQKEHRVNYLNPHRLCKDHAEEFVKDLRVHSHVKPDDFTGFAFQCYNDHVFDILEESTRLSDQNFPLGQWRLKNKYPPAVTIKLTSGKRAFDECYSFQYRPKKIPKTTHEHRATNLVREYSKAMDTEMELSTRKNMVGYLAGWIAAKFARCLKCETCVDALCSDRKLWFHKFITLKHLKGVCLPSEEMFRICWECERALRLRTSPARLRVWVLRRLAHRFPWARRSARHHGLHHVQLARAVIAKYIPLRVSAPFSSQENQRILDIYKLFTCMRSSGLFDQLEMMSRNEDETSE